MKRRYLIKAIAITTLYLLILSNSIAQSHVWLIVDVPNPKPILGGNFLTDLKIASWNGNPGASDFTISFNPKDLKIAKVSIPLNSPFFPDVIIDSLSKSGEVHIASFKSAAGIRCDTIQTIGTITWVVLNGSGLTTDINVNVKDQIISGWKSVDVEAFGQHIEFEVVGIEPTPTENNLIYNYPNPFSSYTIIDYQLSEKTKVNLTICDIRGKLITTLVDQEQIQGHYSVEWNGTDNSGSWVRSGIYICNIIAGDLRKSIKMLLLK